MTVREPDNYVINVAKKRNPEDEYGIHFCNIQLSSNVLNDDKAEEQLWFFRELFGDEYHISMTHWTCRGEVKEEWK